MSIDLSWPESIAVLAGQSQMQVWSKDVYTPLADGYTVESVQCGFLQPVLTGTVVLDSFQFVSEIPASTFDRPSMPRFEGRAEWRGGLLVTEPGPFVLGTTLSDLAAPWPARGALVPFDHDGDGKPGVSAIPRQDGAFALLPLDIGFTQHADQIYMAVRSVNRLSATRAGCKERLEGSIEPLAFNYTVVGCHALDRGECTEREANLIANNSPTYTLAGQGRWTSVPIAETATCADVFAALPSE